MPDKRQHRGAHPEDARDFAESRHETLRRASFELSWLLERGYSERAALKLVGDQHQLRVRQREAVLRASCREPTRAARSARRCTASDLRGAELALDGFNCLIALEVMLSHGPVFRGRDGALRDLASVHGTYRRVTETERAVTLLVDGLVACHVASVHALFDKPVANSGKLRGLMEEALAHSGLRYACKLSDHVDRELVARGSIVASSDAWILDRAAAWVDLPALLAQRHGWPLWLVNLAE